MAKKSGSIRGWSRDEKTAVKTAVELEPQDHGGALAKGGYKGNKGGGRPSSTLRQAFRADLETAREAVMRLLKDDKLTPSELISYMDKCAKYSIDKPVTRDELTALLRRMWDVVAMHQNIKDPTERMEMSVRPSTRTGT